MPLDRRKRCILSKFYIKPQPPPDRFALSVVVSYRNSTSNHNLTSRISHALLVVSYRNSTSNHNENARRKKGKQLYLIEILHQTTTTRTHSKEVNRLYLIEILHQTTTGSRRRRHRRSCILSKFYIKPQPACFSGARRIVVSYRNSTSNHNREHYEKENVRVVSYRNSTSNHNSCICISEETAVVSYRNSTSNHNVGPHID